MKLQVRSASLPTGKPRTYSSERLDDFISSSSAAEGEAACQSRKKYCTNNLN